MSELKASVKKATTILFDMDGTIVNTEPLHAKAASMVLKELKYDIDLMSLISQFYGMTDTVVLKTLIPNLTDAEINDCIQRKNKHLIAIFNELKPSEKEQYLTPGLFSFLRFLKNENKKIAVVSASEDIIVHETLRCFDINPFVQIEMGRNQTALTKPNPDPYIEAMKRFNVHSNETIIFEDSPTGLLSAKRSMAQVIRITAFAHDQNEANKVNDLSDISEIKDFTFAH